MHTFRDLTEKRGIKKKLSKSGHSEGHTGVYRLEGVEKRLFPKEEDDQNATYCCPSKMKAGN